MKSCFVAKVDEGSSKEYNLPRLIRRLQKDYATKSFLMEAPAVDKATVKRHKVTGSQMTGDLKDALMNIIQDIYTHIYTQHDGGNQFVSNRMALAFLLHGQVVLNILKDVPQFSPVLGQQGAAGLVETDYNLVDAVNIASRVQNQELTRVQHESKQSRYEMSASTIESMVKFAQQGSVYDDHPDRSPNPFVDLTKLIIAQFYDEPFEQMSASLSQTSREIALCSSAFAPLSHHLSPLVMHQDKAYLQEYKKAFPTDHFTVKAIPPEV